MMVMAYGLGRSVKNSLEPTVTLNQLSLGQFMSDDLSIFNNTGFIGPQGPVLFDENGDTMAG